MRILRPDLARVILLAVFIAVAVGGSYEANAFHEEDGGRAFGAWTVWMALLAPLGLLLLAIDALGPKLDLFRSPPAIFWIVQIGYFYLLACIIAALAQALRRRARA